MIDGQEWMKKRQEQAKEAFAGHQMKVIGPGHWRIKNPENGQHWADIVVMANVGLAVWGDIDGCFFAYCSGAKTPEQVVAWMANADVSYYGRQKAHIGMNGSELVDEYVAEVAHYDLEQALKQCEEEHDPEEWGESRSDSPSPKMVYEDAFSEARESIECGEHIEGVLRELCDTLMRAGVDDTPYEWVFSIGRVTSCRVIYALAAVARLHELLQAE
jgi:hypothetical protein